MINTNKYRILKNEIDPIEDKFKGIEGYREYKY